MARFVPVVIATELAASLRTALFPLARLTPLPVPSAPCGRAPAVLVHGFMGHPDMLRPLSRRLLREGWTDIERVGYPSLSASMEEIAFAIGRVVEKKGEPVDLVGHSLGAVACRAYLKIFGGTPYVRRFVSLGGPHAGTSLYRVVPSQLTAALDPRGPWVGRLALGNEPVPTWVIRARYDHQVLPPVRASLAGAQEIVLEGYGHNGLLWAKAAHDAVIKALTAHGV